MSGLIYEKNILIRSEQVNMHRLLRTSDLFRLMEEASIAHTEELGCTRDRTLDRGLLWIITRQEACIDEMPSYDEMITIRSWQGEMMHVFFPRFYEVYKESRRIIRGRALWMLIREDTREMVMPEDYDIEIPGIADGGDCMLQAVRLPESAGSALFEYPVTTRFSQVDINGHMNNTKYFDLIDDAMERSEPGWLGSHVPHVIRANYIAELREGDSFVLAGYNENGTWYYQGADNERTKFMISMNY